MKVLYKLVCALIVFHPLLSLALDRSSVLGECLASLKAAKAILELHCEKTGQAPKEWKQVTGNVPVCPISKLAYQFHILVEGSELSVVVADPESHAVQGLGGRFIVFGNGDFAFISDAEFSVFWKNLGKGKLVVKGAWRKAAQDILEDANLK